MIKTDFISCVAAIEKAHEGLTKETQIWKCLALAKSSMYNIFESIISSDEIKKQDMINFIVYYTTSIMFLPHEITYSEKKIEHPFDESVESAYDIYTQVYAEKDAENIIDGIIAEISTSSERKDGQLDITTALGMTLALYEIVTKKEINLKEWFSF